MKIEDREVYIVSACRTPIGDFGGAFKEVRADILAGVAAVEAVERAGIKKDQVEDIIWGECHQQLDQCNTARVMSQRVGFPHTIPGVTVNKVCTSAMQALIFGSQVIKL